MREIKRLVQCSRIPYDGAAAQHALSAWKVTDAGSDLTAGKRFDQRECCSLVRQFCEHDTFKGLIILGEYKMAEPFAHLNLDRSKLASYIVQVSAANRELSFELRIMGT